MGVPWWTVVAGGRGCQCEAVGEIRMHTLDPPQGTLTVLHGENTTNLVASQGLALCLLHLQHKAGPRNLGAGVKMWWSCGSPPGVTGLGTGLTGNGSEKSEVKG